MACSSYKLSMKRDIQINFNFIFSNRLKWKLNACSRALDIFIKRTYCFFDMVLNAEIGQHFMSCLPKNIKHADELHNFVNVYINIDIKCTDD